MAENVGAVSLGIKIDNSTIGSQVQNAGNTIGSTLKGILSNTVSFALGQGLFQTVTQGFKDTLGAAIQFDSNMETYLTQFKTLLGGNATEAKSMMNSLNAIDLKSPLDMTTLSKAATTMLSFGVNSKQVVPVISELGDISQGSSEKFQALSLAFAQTSSAGKLTGQDLLQYISAGFNPLQIISEKTGKSMAELRAEMGKGQISAADVANAFQIATSAGGQFYNATNNMSQTFAGRMDMLQSSAQETLGAMIKPLFNDFSNVVLPKLSAGMDAIANTFSSTGNVMQSIAAGIKTEFGAGAANTFTTIGNAVKDVFGWLETHGPLVKTAIIGIGLAFASIKTVSGVAGVVGTFTNGLKGLSSATGLVGGFGKAIGALSLIKSPKDVFSAIQIGIESVTGMNPQVVLIGLAIAAVAALAILVIKNWGPISGFFKGLWGGVVSAFNTAKTAIVNVMNLIGGFFKTWGPLILAVTAPIIGLPLLIIQHWGQIATFFIGLGTSIKAGLITAFNAARVAVMAVITPFINAVKTPFSNLIKAFQLIWAGVQNVFMGYWNLIKNVVLGIVLVFIDLFQGHWTQLASDLTHINQNISNALTQIWTGISQIGQGIFNAFKAVLQTIWAGISFIFISAGNAIMGFLSAVWNGIYNTAVSVWNAVVGFFAGLPGRIGGIMNSIGSWVQGVWNGLIGFIYSVPGRFSAGLSGLGGAIRGAFSDAISFITGLPGQAFSWGRDIINGIVNGIKSAAGAVGSAVNGVAQDIRKFLHFSEPDVGPLVGFHSWWKDMMVGMGDDITGNKGYVLNAVNGVASQMSAVLQPKSQLAYAGAGYANNSNAQPTSKVTINLNGNYNFRNRDDIDYMNNQLALIINRNK